MRQMTVRHFVSGLALTGILGISACSGSSSNDDGGSGSANEQAQASDLQGAWQSNCQDAVLFGLTESSRLTISGLSATQLTTISSTGECQTPSVEVTQPARFNKGGESSANVRKIDITVQSVIVKPLSESGVAILNLASFCDHSNWQVGVARDVSAQTGGERCFPRVPSTLFEIYTIENNSLYFGQGEGSNDASRPVRIDRERVYVRQ